MKFPNLFLKWKPRKKFFLYKFFSLLVDLPYSLPYIHALLLRCCHFFFPFGSCFFFHNVPSLQQNIHIKTLADDMVRCSAQLWCALVLFDIILCFFVQCCMRLNSTEMYGWIKLWDRIKMNVEWNKFQVCKSAVSSPFARRNTGRIEGHLSGPYLAQQTC